MSLVAFFTYLSEHRPTAELAAELADAYACHVSDGRRVEATPVLAR